MKGKLFDDTKNRLDNAVKTNTLEEYQQGLSKSPAETGLPRCNSSVVKNSLAVQETQEMQV